MNRCLMVYGAKIAHRAQPRRVNFSGIGGIAGSARSAPLRIWAPDRKPLAFGSLHPTSTPAASSAASGLICNAKDCRVE